MDGPKLDLAGGCILFRLCHVLKIDFISESHFWLLWKKGEDLMILGKCLQVTPLGWS